MRSKPTYADIQLFNILRLSSKPIGQLITYVKCDFDEAALKSLGSNIRHLSKSDEYSVYTLTVKGVDLTFMATGSGSASFLTGLYEVLSSKLASIVRIGACGGLNDTKVDEIISCESSLCMDRISSVLTNSESASPDSLLTTRINDAFARNQIAVRSARNVSVEAMYLFEEDLKEAEKKGASCWDLETATLFGFCSKYHIKSASVLQVVSDRTGRSSESYPPIKRIDYVRSLSEALAEA